LHEPEHRLEVVDALAAPPVWAALRNQAEAAAQAEPTLASLLNAVILSHDTLTDSMSYQLARKLGDQEMRAMSAVNSATRPSKATLPWRSASGRPEGGVRARSGLQDLCAAVPVLQGLPGPADLPGGQLAVAARPRHPGPLPAEPHVRGVPGGHPPAATIGSGIFLDHGTGIVIGETAVVEDDVSMLHGVTLGGTGAERGDRHPKIGKGVLLGAGAKVLGNIKIGDYAKIASGSVVLKPVPPGCTAAGVPARLVNCPTCDEPARSMDHTLAEEVYDYVI